MAQLRNITDTIRQDLGLPKEAYRYPLEVKALHYRIGAKTILQGVELHLDYGEVVAVVGPNGAGKSTLLKLMSGDLLPTLGGVILDGTLMTLYPPGPLALKRAVMSQQAVITAPFSVRDVVAMGRYPQQRFGSAQADDEAIITAALAETETLELQERLYPTLSGGEQARVTLARVLAQQAPLLLLDEPTAALDLRHQQLIMRTARRLASEGAGVLMILHDLNLAAAYAHRVVMLQHGQVYQAGPPADVLTEAHIEAVFNLPVRVLAHPHPPMAGQPCPLIVPMGLP
jgi:iron complex transport system ATP-binding protein